VDDWPVESPWRNDIRGSVDVVGCDTLGFLKKSTIGAASAMASTAITKSLLIFIEMTFLIAIATKNLSSRRCHVALHCIIASKNAPHMLHQLTCKPGTLDVRI